MQIYFTKRNPLQNRGAVVEQDKGKISVSRKIILPVVSETLRC